MPNTPKPVKGIALLLAAFVFFSNLLVVGAQDAPLRFKLSPSTVPAGRSRTVKIRTESGADLTGIELQKPSGETGVIIEEPGGQLVDGGTAIIARVKVDEDADEQVLPLTLVKKENGAVVETFTVDLTISGFLPKVVQKKPVPSNLKYEVDAQFQPMSYRTARDVFGRRVADNYYAVVVNLGNNSGYDLQINKIGFITIKQIEVAEFDTNGNPIFKDGKVKTSKDLLAITAIDRSLVRSSIERDQLFGTRALALNLIGGVGTLATGFLPFFHAVGPRANFSSFTSIVNGQLRDGFTLAVPDLTIRHLNRLDNSLVMDQDFILPNNQERNTVVFVPRSALELDKKHQDGKDLRDELRLVKQTLGKLVIVGRAIERFENREIVVRSERPSLEPSPFTTAGPSAPTAPLSIERITPAFGVLSDSTDVIITGSGFTPGTAVKVMFGDRQTTGVALTSTTVHATVPPNATAGDTDVQVIVNEDRKDKLENGYSYIDELSVEAIEPATGPAAGDTTVRVSGRGFLSGAQVRFGDVEATNVTVSNDHTFITATLPAHAPGEAEVVVTNPNGKSASAPNRFTYTQ